MIAGSQVMEVAKKQQKELLKTKKELERERVQEEELQRKLQEKEKNRMKIMRKFNNLQEVMKLQGVSILKNLDHGENIKAAS